jgi:hypothetical protein
MIKKTKYLSIILTIFFIQLFIFSYKEEEIHIYQGLEIKVIEMKRADSWTYQDKTYKANEGYEFVIVCLNIKWTEDNREFWVRRAKSGLVDINGNKHELIDLALGTIPLATTISSTQEIAFSVPLNTRFKTLKIYTLSFDLERFEKERNDN